MELSPLTALSPLDGRYAPQLDSLRSTLSEYGLMRYRLEVEVRWLMSMATHEDIKEVPKLSPEAQDYLLKLIDHFDEKAAMEVKLIEKTTNHDVKAIEYYLQQKFEGQAELKNLIPFIHFACTSEDINNLAYALMLKNAFQHSIAPRMQQLIDSLSSMAKQYAHVSMLARTHGQAATPTTLGKELINFVARLQRAYQSIAAVEILGKFNGAVGNHNAHCVAYPEVNWLALSEQFVKSLGLTWNAFTTQIESHDELANFLQALMRFNTIMIDLDRDLWSYISVGYFKQRLLDHEVGSSTMPHKVNPIDFENSEGNLGVANALADHLALKLPISRLQRDLSDSTVLRNLGPVLGYSLLAYQSTLKGLSKLEANENFIREDLEQHWEVLAEAIQTVMRRYGLNNAYEELKKLTRGKEINEASIRAFIDNLDLEPSVKEQLLQLTPSTYIGYAKKLVDQFFKT